MEYIREARIDLYIDTNKRTVEKRFSSLGDLQDFLAGFDENVTLPEALSAISPDECDKCGDPKLLICVNCYNGTQKGKP